MAKPLDVGDKVLCRYFNTPDNKFVGPTFEAEIMSISEGTTKNQRQFVVRRFDRKPVNAIVTIWRKEIIRRLS